MLPISKHASRSFCGGRLDTGEPNRFWKLLAVFPQERLHRVARRRGKRERLVVKRPVAVQPHQCADARRARPESLWSMRTAKGMSAREKKVGATDWTVSVKMALSAAAKWWEVRACFAHYRCRRDAETSISAADFAAPFFHFSAPPNFFHAVLLRWLRRSARLRCDL